MSTYASKAAFCLLISSLSIGMKKESGFFHARRYDFLSPDMMYNRQQLAFHYNNLFGLMGSYHIKRQQLGPKKALLPQAPGLARTHFLATQEHRTPERYVYINNLSAIAAAINKINRRQEACFPQLMSPYVQDYLMMEKALEDYLIERKDMLKALYIPARKAQYFFDCTIPAGISRELIEAGFREQAAKNMEMAARMLKEKLMPQLIRK